MIGGVPLFTSAAKNPDDVKPWSWRLGPCSVRVCLGDITNIKADAIVNAANTELWMGGGVAGAIRRVGGAGIEREAMAQGPISVGEAVVTGAGALPCNYVIHAATLEPGKKSSENNVRMATSSALKACAERGIGRVVFPLLGSGTGGLSLTDSAKAMLETIRNHAQRSACPFEVVFAVTSHEAYHALISQAGMVVKDRR